MGDCVPSPSVQWLQTSSEVFFRKVSFWDKGGRDAPPVFNVDGVSYLYVKVPLKSSFMLASTRRTALGEHVQYNACMTLH